MMDGRSNLSIQVQREKLYDSWEILSFIKSSLNVETPKAFRDLIKRLNDIRYKLRIDFLIT